MDDFREWLSDNLRYFMLGGAILIVVLVLFFSIRACAGRRRNRDNQPTQETQQEQNTSGGDEGTQSQEADNPLTPADQAVRDLIGSYYTAMGNRDLEALRQVVSNLSPADEAKISAQDYVERYQVGDVYTKKGLDDTSYAVYACVDCVFQGIGTAEPTLSQLYVITDTDGSLKVDGTAESNSQISSLLNQLKNDSDVKELADKVQQANDAALAADSALADFLNGLGTAQTSGTTQEESTDEGNKMTVTADYANVRSEPNSDSDDNIIGGYEEGASVTVTGQEDDWIQIDYNGQTGYIYSSLLE